MGLTRQEINLRRLLAKCELLIKDKERDEERFLKYIKSLESMLREVTQLTDDRLNLTLIDYERRIHNLKRQIGLVDCDFDDRTDRIVKGNADIELRNELFGVRKRNLQDDGLINNEQIDKVIDYHQKQQDKIAQDMLSLTRNLKEQSELANRIIKKDTEVVGQSMQLTEQNFSKLKQESETLQEHSKRSCKCWMWMILLIVLIVFVVMVLFMKVAKKRY